MTSRRVRKVELTAYRRKSIHSSMLINVRVYGFFTPENVVLLAEKQYPINTITRICSFLMDNQYPINIFAHTS